MDRRCVLGCFPNENELQFLLNNLREIGLEDGDISIVTVLDKLEHLFGTVLGPLRSADLNNLAQKIGHLGFGIDIARSIKNYLTDGGAVAIAACDDLQMDSVIQAFEEFGATRVEVSE